ncbi:MAG: MarR family transcriptional regulator [Sphaerochaetaceae bacterium]|jgi:DNA-binding MarR family transcriptional regulator
MNRYPVSFILFSLTNAVKRTVNESLARHNLNAVEAKTLGILTHRNEPICQNDIGQTFGCSRSNISGVLDTMERNGLIKRECDTGDKRRKILVLTDQGKMTAHECEAVFDEVDENLYRMMGEDGYRLIKGLLDKMTGALGKHEQDTDQQRT